MKSRNVILALAAFILSACATVAFVALMLSRFGPSRIADLHLLVGINAIGVMAALWWFAYLALGRGHGTLRRFMVAAISGVMALVGIFSAMLTHHACVCLTQRVEASCANLTCGQVRRIETACTKLLNDAGMGRFRTLLVEDARNMPLAELVPELLRHGRQANVPLEPGIRARLAPSYLAAGMEMIVWWRPVFSTFDSPGGLADAWGRAFQFSENGGFTVSSLGRDGTVSEDDIRRDFLPEMDHDLAAFEFYDAYPVNRTPFARLYTRATGKRWLSSNDNILHRE